MKKLWFKRRRYGWGWTPVTTEGWLVLLAYIVGMIVIANTVNNTKVIIPFIVLTAVFIFILYKTGEKPRWTWGNDTDSTG